MRATRSRVKRAIKQRVARHTPRKSTDGVGCPHCEPSRNGRLHRDTMLARIHQAEIDGR
jgi:hypothetical protein